MPPKDDQAYVLDMLEAARLIRDYMEGVDRMAFNRLVLLVRIGLIQSL